MVGPRHILAKIPRRAKWLQRLGIAAAVYTILGFLALPAVIKWQLRKQLPALTHRQARVETVRVNPYALSLTIRGLSLTEPDGARFASWSNFYVNFEALGSLVSWSWTFKRIQLDEPYGYVAWLTNGQFNFANMLTNNAGATTNAGPSSSPPRVRVHSLIVSNGALEFADFNRSAPFRTRFTPINVRLTGFTTRPRTDNPYSFTASTGEGESFSWAGDFSVVPLASRGQFDLSGIDLKKYGPYAADFVQFEVREGKVSLAAQYRFAFGTNGLDVSVTNANVGMTGLQVRAPDTDDTVVSVPAFALRGAVADLRERTASVAGIQTADGTFLARRYRSGELQFLALAKPAATNLKSAPLAVTNSSAANDARAWSVRVETFVVSNYTVKIEDAQPATPARLVADQIALTLTNVSNLANSPAGVQFSARINEGGTAQVSARVVAFPPLRADAEVALRDLDLRPLQPYVAEQVKLAITGGRVTTQGRATFALEGTNTPLVTFAGDVLVDDFTSVDQILFQNFAQWKQIALKGIDVSLNPLSLRLQELSCDRLATGIVLDTNRQPTFLGILPARTNAVTNVVAAVPGTNAAPPLNIQIAIVAFTNASLQLADFSVQPPCKFAVQDFSGTVKGISGAPDSAADVDISGRVDEGAPFTVRGRVTPLAPDLLADIAISAKNTELTAFTPYMEKFAGYPLKKGKLTVDLRYDLKQRALKAENAVLIDQLTLGQRNDSPDATKLPVKLGIALLKDRNGRIDLNVPVSGRLDDPKFKVGPVILQVVLNMLAKAATSPFALLGALVGGGEELSFVEFAAGQSLIPDEQAAKIDKLSRALYERPALNLEIVGDANESLDRAALAWLRMEHELKSLRVAELAGKRDAPASAEDVRFDSRDYARALKAYYKQTFNRVRPLPADGAVLATNHVSTLAIGAAKNAPSLRGETRKGAEILFSRERTKPVPKATNIVAVVTEPRLLARPATLPVLDATDELLAQMEGELFARVEITGDDLRELKQKRAQSVQRALLQTQKVEGERLFILAPKASDAASKGQARVNLSLN